MAPCPNCRPKMALPKGRTAFNCYSCMSRVKLCGEFIRHLSAEIVFCMFLIPLSALNFACLASWFVALTVASAAGLVAWFWLGAFSLTLDQE